ncbi:MAG: CoA:oxalate CoA-transferase [Gammaproteobacteria bacterium]|jgi:CoA:oxalate CoA-transferase
MLDHLPLKDLRVLDLSQGIAGPCCGGLFAEYGARVIKIEPTGGDWMRALGPGFDDRSAGFMYYNRGKESLALDLKHAGALDVVLAHAERADVLIENNRPGVTERLGFGFEAVKARQPRIVYVSISGLGREGPEAQRPLSDTVAQARSGFMQINRGRADAPGKVDTTLIDATTGLYAFQCASMALWGDPAHRQARHVDVSLLQSAAALQGPKILEYGILGHMPEKLNSPAGGYPTANGWIAVTLVQESGWPAICKAIGHEELINEPRFTTFAERARHSDELTAILDNIFRAHDTSHWVDVLTAERVLASPINDYGDWLADPQTQATTSAPDSPLRGDRPGPVARTPGRVPFNAPSPHLGEHSRQLLEEAGVASATIDEMLSAGAIVTPA